MNQDTTASEVNYRVRPDLDLTNLSDLFHQSWGGRVRPHHFSSVLSRSFTWVAAFSQSGELVGYVNVAWDGGVHFFLLDTTVHPGWRRQGVGTELVRRAIEVCRGHGEWIHVDSGSELANFYREAGFRDSEWAGLVRL